jgi:nucleotidyltransferase substrate binding protein (TIGR01987 family)
VLQNTPKIFILYHLPSKKHSKAGVIQNFKISYELSWKFIKRWLEVNEGQEIVDGVTRRELYRIAFENRLIENVEEWMNFHSTRNITSHSYDAEVANNAYETAVHFLPFAKKLLERLTLKND